MMDLWYYGVTAECPASNCDYHGDFPGKNCPKCGVEIVVLVATREGYHAMFGEEAPRQNQYTGPQLVRD